MADNTSSGNSSTNQPAERTRISTNAPELRNLSQSELGPGGGPKGVVVDQGTQVLDVFEQLIGNLFEKDYGDFKRKANGYMDRCAADLTGSSKEVKQIFARMKHYINFTIDSEIEATRSRILSDVQAIRRTMRG